ncbi:hypothetical protein Tco_0713931 [Tanacetum coccineum]
MDQDSVHMVAASKVPMLKQCDGGDDVVDVMDLRWRRGGDDVVDRRWLVMEEGDDGSGGGWPEFGRSGAGYL